MSIKNLYKYQGFLRYFKNTSWVFFERIFRMTINLFVYVWVARYLGPENFGLYNYSIAFVGLFGALATLGLDEIVVSRLVKEETKPQNYWNSHLIKVNCCFLLLLFITLILFATSEDQKTNVLILIVASSLIFQSFNIFDLFFQSKVFKSLCCLCKFSNINN